MGPGLRGIDPGLGVKASQLKELVEMLLIIFAQRPPELLPATALLVDDLGIRYDDAAHYVPVGAG